MANGCVVSVWTKQLDNQGRDLLVMYTVAAEDRDAAVEAVRNKRASANERVEFAAVLSEQTIAGLGLAKDQVWML
jgi:hypothetical protein